MNNQNNLSYQVSVDFGEGEITHLEIHNQTKEQIKELFNNYNQEYNTGVINGDFTEYLASKQVEFNMFVFDIVLSV